MSAPILSLGMFLFELPSLVHQSMDVTSSARFAEGERIGARATLQFIGPGQMQVTLSGVTAWGLMDDRTALAELEEMQGSGQAWPLIDADGEVLGLFVITGIGRRGTMIGADGRPRRTEWTLDLLRAPDGEGETTAGQVAGSQPPAAG